MNENTEKLVRELADKLGTTADHLWAILTQQAAVWSYTAIVIDTGTILLALVLLVWGICIGRKVVSDNSEEYLWIPVVIAAVGGIVFFVGVINICCDLPSIVSGLFNPEYWAFKQIWR